MHPNAQTIQRFYEAFQRRDTTTMVACYAPDVQFSDPVFTDLKGPRAGAMWKMLGAKATGLRIEFRDVEADDQAGRAHWEAWYPFSQTGRPVHNVIDARFEFRDGKIVKHTDVFDLHRWAGMALGAPGKLLGWTPFLQGKIRGMAEKNLQAWMAATGAG